MLPHDANICQGCKRGMPLQEEKTHVPHVGNFHVRCAPEMTGLEKFLIEQDARRAARRV